MSYTTFECTLYQNNSLKLLLRESVEELIWPVDRFGVQAPPFVSSAPILFFEIPFNLLGYPLLLGPGDNHEQILRPVHEVWVLRSWGLPVQRIASLIPRSKKGALSGK